MTNTPENNIVGGRQLPESLSSGLLQSIADASPLAIYIMQDEKIKFVSRQFQEITGFTRKQIFDTRLLDLVPAADRDVVKASTIYTLKKDKSYPCEYRILHKSGKVKWVMQTVAPFFYENREAILGSLMDITERKYLERKVIEYEELDRMKGDILAKVSHELRTPLAAIKGYATMMLDHRNQINPDESMEYLISINNNADRLTDMINNLLDSSRLDSGMLELKKARTSITGLIKSVVKIARVRINGQSIITRLPVSLPRIYIDARRIRQVLENLIFNAAERSPDGEEILVSAARKGRNIEISVTDRGEVIAENELKSIFDRMYKIENTEKGTDGMGLGLYICQRLVEAHGGYIRAQSNPEDGTILRFSLPVHPRKKRIKSGYGQNKLVSFIL